VFSDQWPETKIRVSVSVNGNVLLGIGVRALQDFGLTLAGETSARRGWGTRGC
jgi:hypothetical protein